MNIFNGGFMRNMLLFAMSIVFLIAADTYAAEVKNILTTGGYNVFCSDGKSGTVTTNSSVICAYGFGKSSKYNN